MRHIRQVAISAFLCTMVSGWALAQSPNPEGTGYIPELKEWKVAVAQGNAPAGGRGAAPARGTQRAQRGGPAASTPVYANLAQLMRGILYPNSNVIFFVQDKDPAGIKAEGDPATAVNPLASTYGGWEAVQNSALALSEAANLLLIPGRKCANGRSVPLQNPDWAKFVQGLRDAGMTVYKAAQSKDQDKILEAADVMTTACSNCHDKYREKPNLAERCQ